MAKSTGIRYKVATVLPRGFEPQFQRSKRRVLPLDEGKISWVGWIRNKKPRQIARAAQNHSLCAITYMYDRTARIGGAGVAVDVCLKCSFFETRRALVYGNTKVENTF
jgi:hypothetical protein